MLLYIIYELHMVIIMRSHRVEIDSACAHGWLSNDILRYTHGVFCVFMVLSLCGMCSFRFVVMRLSNDYCVILCCLLASVCRPVERSQSVKDVSLLLSFCMSLYAFGTNPCVIIICGRFT